MKTQNKCPVHFVLIKKDAVVRDAEVIDEDNKHRKPGNNGRKILAKEVIERFGEKEISDPLWTVPYVLPTGEGGVEVATFTEYAGQDRHKHDRSIEIYTVLKGSMQIYINDDGPHQVNELDEIVILPGTIHEVVEQQPAQENANNGFSLLVRVHAIDCYGDVDKFVQFSPDGEWKRWDSIPREEKPKAYRKQVTK